MSSFQNEKRNETDQNSNHSSTSPPKKKARFIQTTDHEPSSSAESVVNSAAVGPSSAENSNENSDTIGDDDINDDKNDTSSDTKMIDTPFPTRTNNRRLGDGDNDDDTSTSSATSASQDDKNNRKQSETTSINRQTVPSTPVITEGNTTIGTIKQGDNYQATVPPAPAASRMTYRSTRIQPKHVWKAGAVMTATAATSPNENNTISTRQKRNHTISEEKLESYLSQAATKLKAYVESNGMVLSSTGRERRLKRRLLLESSQKQISSSTSTSESSPTAPISGDLTPSSEQKVMTPSPIHMFISDNSTNPKSTATLTSTTTGSKSTATTQTMHTDFREMDKDAILALLHTHSYNIHSALRSIDNHPSKYLTLWTLQEQEQFHIGFQKHLNSLRHVSKCIPTKSHKDVTDYHYRFKIPDQFLRYEDKKREQARRMMECVERRRLDFVTGRLNNALQADNTSDARSDDRNSISGGGGGAGTNGLVSTGNNGNGGASKKIHDWTKTGGSKSPNKIGSTESRRLKAKEFLTQIREKVNERSYTILLNYLKDLNVQQQQQQQQQQQSQQQNQPEQQQEQSQSPRNTMTMNISQLKEGFGKELEKYPDLLEQFHAFLPMKFRTS